MKHAELAALHTVSGVSPPDPIFFDASVPAHLADAGLIRLSPGGWERNMFLSET